MLITGDPGSELQQYLQRAGHPRVGMSITWKGFFMLSSFVPPAPALWFPIRAPCSQSVEITGFQSLFFHEDNESLFPWRGRNYQVNETDRRIAGGRHSGGRLMGRLIKIHYFQILPEFYNVP